MLIFYLGPSPRNPSRRPHSRVHCHQIATPFGVRRDPTGFHHSRIHSRSDRSIRCARLIQSIAARKFAPVKFLNNLSFFLFCGGTHIFPQRPTPNRSPRREHLSRKYAYPPPSWNRQVLARGRPSLGRSRRENQASTRRSGAETHSRRANEFG